MTISRHQTTINERLAKYCTEQKINISLWEPIAPMDLTTAMVCINKQMGLQTSEPIADDVGVYFTKAQCVCGSHLKSVKHMMPIWLPSHDKQKYALLGINCFDIWFNDAEPSMQRKCNDTRNRVARARGVKLKLKCLTCGLPNSQSHVTYATGDFINHHTKCMTLEKRYEFETKYSHTLQKNRTTFKCSVCGVIDSTANKWEHNDQHREFISVCKYRFKNGKHAGESLWDVLIDNPGYIEWLKINGFTSAFRGMISTLITGVNRGWIYGK